MSRFRQPLFWIVLGGVVVLLALFAISWRVYQGHRPAASADVPLPQAAASPPAGAARSTPRVLPSPRTSPAPAARRPAAFPIDLATLNRDQAALERAEAAVVTELIRSARAYLEGVVVPAVRRAERVSMVIAPATMQRPAAIRKRL